MRTHTGRHTDFYTEGRGWVQELMEGVCVCGVQEFRGPAVAEGHHAAHGRTGGETPFHHKVDGDTEEVDGDRDAVDG